jgi:FkbM family methyltransferase
MRGMLIERLGIYWKEVPVCLTLGTGIADRFYLVWTCMAFHIANILGLKPKAACKRFSITLENTRADLTLRSYSGDIFVFQEVLGLKCYRISQLCETDGVIVDLGANIGLASLYFADRYNPKRLICVEPNPNNIPILRHNVSGLGSRVTIVHAAIADSTGIVSFDSNAATYGGTIAGDGDPVPSYSMSDFVRRHVCPDRIRLLKIDIEGAERLLFRGNPEWLKLVDSIIIELHAGMSLEDFERVVCPYGFRVLLPGSEYGNLLPMAISKEAY